MKTGKTLLFLCCLGCFHGSRAQNAGDSLFAVLQHHPQPDTARLRLLNAASFAFYNSNPEKGRALADSAIALARVLTDMTAQATAWRNRGLNCFRQGEDSLALAAYRQAFDLDRVSDNKKGMGKTLHALGLLYNSQSEYTTAIDYHQQALDISSGLKDSIAMANAANSIGINYLYLANYPRAIEYYQRALTVYQRQGDQHGMGLVYTNLGIVYRRMSKPVISIDYCNKALACYAGRDEALQKANVLANMANVYDDMGDMMKALSYYTGSLQIQESVHNERGIASNCLNMGIVYGELGKYAEAFAYLRRGLQIYTAAADKSSMAIALSELGKLCQRAPADVLREQGIALGERYARAIRYEQAALGLAEDIGSTDTQRDIWEILSGIYESKGETGSALAAYKKFVLLKDSVLNDDSRQKITRLTLEYEHDKKEAALKADFDGRQALAAAALSRQRWVTGIVLVALVGLTTSGWLGFRFYKRRQKAERKAELTELEMKVLRSRMNPHFIFNSLNSIGDYVLRHRPEEANEYLTRFARLMWLILENTEHKEVSVSDDINAMRLYMELESKRLVNGFQFTMEVDKGIDTENTYIPPLILQPFIENSIWHGLAGLTEREGRLSVSIGADGQQLRCVVEDNGVGRKTEAVAGKKRSYGIRLTTERIELLNKAKNYNATVRVTDLEQGTRVEVWLPLSVG
jgi:tetratricopeptide (TPR) repeat protein